jgi:hypothetical protein
VVYIFIYVWYGYDTIRAKAMTTFDEYNNNIEEYPTLTAGAMQLSIGLLMVYSKYRSPDTRFYGVCRNYADILYLILILCQF